MRFRSTENRAGLESATTRMPRPEEVGGAFGLTGMYRNTPICNQVPPPLRIEFCSWLIFFLLLVLFRVVPLLPLGFNTRRAHT